MFRVRLGAATRLATLTVRATRLSKEGDTEGDLKAGQRAGTVDRVLMDRVLVSSGGGEYWRLLLSMKWDFMELRSWLSSLLNDRSRITPECISCINFMKAIHVLKASSRACLNYLSMLKLGIIIYVFN